jgi:tRNA 2-thiouridine synthesizing protein C
MNKKLLFVSRHAPYGSSIAKEALDAVLAASVYEQTLSLLFMNDGVFQLLKEQDGAQIEQKSFSAMLPVLSLYDVERIYVHQESLLARNLQLDELAIEHITMLTNDQVGELFSQQDQILSF